MQFPLDKISSFFVKCFYDLLVLPCLRGSAQYGHHFFFLHTRGIANLWKNLSHRKLNFWYTITFGQHLKQSPLALGI